MVVVKSSHNRELSDKGVLYWDYDNCTLESILNEDAVLCGDDVVSRVFHRPLSEVIGCRIRYCNHMVTANYEYSKQKEFAGRDKAYWKIMSFRPLLSYGNKSPEELVSEDQIGETAAFDCETGGKTGVRCITFYDGERSTYVDCRDLKSNTSKREMLRGIFKSSRKWIAHNFAHDCEQVMKLLDVPFFPVHMDSITLTDGYEFRSLQYLTGVVLGVAPYKHELESANIRDNFQDLVKYCAKDSFYTYHLANNVHLPDKMFVNQFIHTMLFPPNFKPKASIFEIYPDWAKLTKKKLKEKLKEVPDKHIETLLNTIEAKKVKITLHSMDGFNVRVPEDLVYDGDLYFKSSCGDVDITLIQAKNKHFNSPELSVYRYNNKIEPSLFIPNYNIEPEKVFLVNDVICLTKEPTEGFTKCAFEQVRRLFYGR